MREHYYIFLLNDAIKFSFNNYLRFMTDHCILHSWVSLRNADSMLEFTTESTASVNGP